MTMKGIKLAISILSIMLIAFTGCNREEIEITPEILPESVTISASIDIDDTKVNYVDQGTVVKTHKVYWNANEDISMVYSTGTASEFILFSKDGDDSNVQNAIFGTSSALPAPTINDVYFISPGNGGIKTNQTSVSIDFSHQDGSHADAATRHLMVADYGDLSSWSGVNVSFQHKVAIMKLKFYFPSNADDCFVTEIRFSGAGLINKGTYDLATDTWTADPDAGEIITIKFGGDGLNTYEGDIEVFFAIIPGTTITNYKAYAVVEDLYGYGHGKKTYAFNVTSSVKTTAGKVYIKELSSPTIVTPNPTNQQFYTGAFWRHNQTGERLISLPMSASDLGPWIVEVENYGYPGTQFNVGEIVFSKTPSTDPNINNLSLAADMNNLANDVLYNVNNGTKTIGGNITSAGSYITFRVGLTSNLPGGEFGQPKYALIRVIYAGGAKTHSIFLRQGQEADYLMRPSDPPAGQRTSAVKWSPYNLTVPQFNTGTSVVGAIQVGINGTSNGGVPGVWTDYPSKVGAHFQWGAHATLHPPRYAYNPAVSQTLPGSGFATVGSTDHWSVMSATHETCPVGYRRFGIGATNAYVNNVNLANNEYFQSLAANLTGELTKAQTAVPPIFANMLLGKYADGYYDRRSHAHATIRPSIYVANPGVLFYNIRNLATLFMPTSGARESMTDGVATAMDNITLWSSTTGMTSYYNTEKWFLIIGYDGSWGDPAYDRWIHLWTYTNTNYQHAYTIRCVRP